MTINEKNFSLTDVSSSAAALFDGGWRSTDAEQLKSEYDLTDEEVSALVVALKKYEEVK